MSNSASSSRGEFVLWAAPALALLTLAVSLAVSFVVNGTAFSTVPVKDLAKWGGLRLSTFDINDSWRVLTAQLVHVRWPHMLFNVVCLAAVSSLVERRIGAAGTLLIWVLIGGAATAVSPVFVKPPYDVGTGASQAVLAFAGYAIVMRVRGGLKGGARRYRYRAQRSSCSCARHGVCWLSQDRPPHSALRRHCGRIAVFPWPARSSAQARERLS